MEVSGKSVPPSGKEPRLICLPCDREGLKESVYGFCQDCQEHLCETCFKHHKRPRPSRNHVLLGRDKMPKHQTIDPLSPDDRMDFCGNHKDKTLEFYCTTHRVVACYVCVTLEHKQCKVDYIPDISGQVTDEFRSLIAQMQHLMKKCKSNVKNAETASEKLHLGHRKVVEEVKLLREEINYYLDQMEAEITKEAKAFVNTAKRKQENIKADSVKIAEEVSCSLTYLNTLNEENQQNKLFIEMKKAEDRLSELTTKEIQILQDYKTEGNIKFTRNQQLIDLLKSENNYLGTLTVYGEPSADKTVCLEYDGTVSVNSVSDKKDCNISGLVMISPTKMVVADLDNNSIKLIDIEKGTLSSEKILSSEPHDVISLPQNKLAVALREEKNIQILSVSGTNISSDRRLVVGDECRGLAFCQDKLVVTCNFNPGKIIIMNLAGDFLKVFDSPGFVIGPEKVIINRDEKFLYVSDWTSARSKVIYMDWEGNVNVFDEPEYRQPYGIQELEDGTLLVCYRDNDTILRLSGSCKKREIKRPEKEEIYRPRALAYSDRNHKLYVSCASKKGAYVCDIIKVFRVKWI